MREYTVREYDMEDYESFKQNLTDSEIVDLLEFIKRGHIGDYGFTGKEDDFERYKLHMAIMKAIDIVKEHEKEHENDIEYNER